MMISGVYSHTDVKLFESKTTFRPVSKNEILLNKGEVCKSFFFSLTGAFYQYKYTDEGEENVLDLHVAHEWFLNQGSFISQTPSDRFIKAYCEGNILELDITSIHELIGESAAFLQLGKILQQATAQAYFFDNRLTPTQKYQYILDNRAALIQHFPLKWIASYLKITPETMSRVRESFAKGKIIS
ncbi:Crp/Fnr family transcriptional regulator [Rhodocytophaga rosea]|uniref:Crp/Fnr family transcriptional regulator n=1 Tax=Rhodocytophaga rosea TaxID=2704465 RepID=A0A6C0GHY6_9BACT|nr:Crp/Fnr family transcriptional regulator [Rhodocytophaga rosea]QHT67330.1 Crp/Fnr family transcriptional regulator [Rhodocytophaga rosea]